LKNKNVIKNNRALKGEAEGHFMMQGIFNILMT